MYWLNNLMVLYWMSYNLMSANGAVVTRVPAKGQWAQLYGTENYKSVYYVANVRRTFADLQSRGFKCAEKTGGKFQCSVLQTSTVEIMYCFTICVSH